MMSAITNELIASKALYKAIDDAAKNGEYSYFTEKPIPENAAAQLLSFGYDLYVNEYNNTSIIRWNDSDGVFYIKKDRYSDYQSMTLDEVYK